VRCAGVLSSAKELRGIVISSGDILHRLGRKPVHCVDIKNTLAAIAKKSTRQIFNDTIGNSSALLEQNWIVTATIAPIES
jgi:hypothetical protein